MASQLAVAVRRRFRASPARIYRAFTDPDELARWFSPSVDIATEVLDHELRVGGAYRIRFTLPGGESNVVRGEFIELDPPERLAFTWTWEAPDPHAGIDTLVTVVLRKDGANTELVLSHDRFPTNASRDRHDDGWVTTLDRLESFVETRAR
jgi:uncharacterized protein YndB with AHSA1/START domain